MTDLLVVHNVSQNVSHIVGSVNAQNASSYGIVGDIQCRFADETLWLTQAQFAELFQTNHQNVTLHLKAIYAEGELDEVATCNHRCEGVVREFLKI